MVGGSFDAHVAEEDCRALLQIFVAYGDELLTYADANASRLDLSLHRQFHNSPS